MSRSSWQPAASMERLRARADLLQAIRAFFHQAGVMEVSTPACSRYAATDPALQSFKTRYQGPGQAQGHPLYLHTSPEFPMKRLLAAGSGAIYQICRVFRDGESGRLHNPEFTLLEWYRPGFDHHQLMGEVERLVESLLPQRLPVTRFSYGDLFQRHLGVDPHRATQEQLRAVAVRQGIGAADELELSGVDPWRDLLLSHCIEPALPDGLCFVYDYPVSQASLARIRPGSPALAERFELYLNRVELANGFHELTDAREQRRRFQAELDQRQLEGLDQPPMDLQLLAALEAGLPECSGVALGVDRLLMVLTGAQKIDEVLAFPVERA